MDNDPLLAKYLELGYRMRLWVARGRADKAAELFRALDPALQRFRSFRRVKHALESDPGGFDGALERLFDSTLLLQKSARFAPWQYRKAGRERFAVE